MDEISDIVDKVIKYWPALAAGIAATAGLAYWRKEGKDIERERQQLYQDVDQIPAEHHPAVFQLLQDLRQDPPQRAGYRIDHLLRKYVSK